MKHTFTGNLLLPGSNTFGFQIAKDMVRIPISWLIVLTLGTNLRTLDPVAHSLAAMAVTGHEWLPERLVRIWVHSSLEPTRFVRRKPTLLALAALLPLQIFELNLELISLVKFAIFEGRQVRSQAAVGGGKPLK